MKSVAFMLAAITAAFFTLFVALGAWIWQIDRTWSPLLEPRLRERAELSSIRVFAKDSDTNDKWIGSITSGRMEERQALKLGDFPPLLIQSVVSIEDPRFLEHGGFDYLGIARAIASNLRSLRFSQGGSTITQQLVKNVFLTHEKTIRRKITELVLSALVEKRFTKDEILVAYANEVYMGQLGGIELHGFGRAAEYYFGKPVQQLALPEMALLAALVNSPGLYNPWKHPDRAKTRRDKVLRLLFEANLILEQEYKQALASPLPKAINSLAKTRAAYLMDALREDLAQSHTEDEFVKGGFDVHLGLDLDLQEISERILRDAKMTWPPEMQGLLIAADPKTCTVKVYAGGADYRSSQLDRIRQSARPIGSLMKPLIVHSLLDASSTSGVTLAERLDDAPLKWSYDHGRQKWEPENYDRKFRGPVTLRQALEESLNVPLVRVFYQLDDSGDLTSALEPLRAMGLMLPTERATPAAILGAVDQSPRNVLSVYLKLVRKALGLAHDTADFECRLNFEPAKMPTTAAPDSHDGPVVGQSGARTVISALEGALRRGTSASLGKTLPTNQAWAGKTGTSSDKRDSWYVALSPDLVVLGWVGRDDNKETTYTGATGAMPFVAHLVKNWSARKNYDSGWTWPMPDSLKWKIVRLTDSCLVPESELSKVSALGEAPKEGAIPAPPVRIDGKDYAWEMFPSERMPQTCK